MFSFNSFILCMNECFLSLGFDFVVYMCDEFTSPFCYRPKRPQFVDHRRLPCLKLIGNLPAAFISRRRDPRGFTLRAMQALSIMFRRVMFVEFILRAESPAEVSIVLMAELWCVVLERESV